jgi:hypothetical protein
MVIRRMIMDKLLGMFGILAALAASLFGLRSVVGLIRAPTLRRRLAGLAGITITLPVAAAGLYVLLRYPAERRSTAVEIARIAARQSTPVTPYWKRD